MILHIMAFFNKKISCYTQPHYIDIEPEKAALQLSRSLQLTEKEDVLNQYKNLDLYYLGDFDDSTGGFIFDEDPRNLLDCTVVIKAKKKKEGKKYVESIPTN